jgi:Fis family transcriptional regulator, factor for inversion stimulation protein
MRSRLETLVKEMVDRGIMFEDAVEEFEQHFILAVLERTNGNLSKAAEELKIHRNTLSKRVEKYYRNGHMTGARRRRSAASKKPGTGAGAAAKSKLRSKK